MATLPAPVSPDYVTGFLTKCAEAGVETCQQAESLLYQHTVGRALRENAGFRDGFLSKCAELGVDPDDALRRFAAKAAQFPGRALNAASALSGGTGFGYAMGAARRPADTRTPLKQQENDNTAFLRGDKTFDPATRKLSPVTGRPQPLAFDPAAGQLAPMPETAPGLAPFGGFHAPTVASSFGAPAQAAPRPGPAAQPQPAQRR
jgi:hypothetical protein